MNLGLPKLPSVHMPKPYHMRALTMRRMMTNKLKGFGKSGHFMTPGSNGPLTVKKLPRLPIA